MDIREAHKQKMAAQLREWSAQISLLEAKVENAGADMRLKGVRELQDLRAKQVAASEKMHELEQAGSEAWEQVKQTADKIWEDLKVGIADAHSRFK